MKRAAFIIAFVVLMVILKGISEKRNDAFVDEPLPTADKLIGTWRELESKETRGFNGDGSTWIERRRPGEGPLSTSDRHMGSYRFLGAGRIEIQLDGEAPLEWKVSYGNDVLRMRSADGQLVGYVNESNIPSDAPFRATTSDAKK
jgi:hypothetical protein